MKKIINQIELINSWDNRILFVITFILCVIPMVFAIFKAPVDVDSGYYLSMVERINDGHVLYKDIIPGYPPLVFYIFLILKKIFSIGINYEFFLTIHFIFQIVSAYFVYKISELYINNKKLSLCAVLLFVLTSYWNQGNVVLLETPSLMFGLIACYYTLKYSGKIFIYLWIGVLASLAFLSKQYGLGFSGLIMYLCLFNKQRWQQMGLFFAGFLLPVLCCYFLFGKPFLIDLTGNGYGYYSELSLKWPVIKLLHFLKIVPCLILGFPLLVFIVRDKIIFRNTSFLILGIGGFSLQFLFAPWAHYYLYMIPFAAILSFYIFSLMKNRILKGVYGVFLAGTMLFAMYSTYYQMVYKNINSNAKEKQYALANRLKNAIQCNTKTLYIADECDYYLYYLTNLLPPNLDYSFGVGISRDRHLEQMKSADYVFKLKEEYIDYDFGLNTNEVHKFLLSKPNEEFAEGWLYKIK